MYVFIIPRHFYRCKAKCTQKFNDVEKACLLSLLYNGRMKNEQDTYLMGLIEAKPIIRHRKRKASNLHNRTASFSYVIVKNGERIPVCKQAFLSLYSISNARVVRLTKLRVEGKSPVDLRGKHSNRLHVLALENLAKIKDHIERFPYKTAHYSSTTIHYLNATLTVKTMYSRGNVANVS